MGYRYGLALLAVIGVGLAPAALSVQGARGQSAIAETPPPASLSECGACHMVYPPQFMPQRSWTAILGKLDDHFGEIATLPDAKRAEILAYLTANAADGAVTGVAGRRFLRGIPPDVAPLRITELPWWIGAHEEVNFTGIKASRIKSASNCLGCHGRDGAGDNGEGGN